MATLLFHTHYVYAATLLATLLLHAGWIDRGRLRQTLWISTAVTGCALPWIGWVASIQLSEGDRYKDWTLEQIETDAALFVRGEEEAWLEISFDVAAPMQPRRRSRKDDEDHEDHEDTELDRPVTPGERQLIMEALEATGCSGNEVEMDFGEFEVEEAWCPDGYSYEIRWDKNFTLVSKVRVQNH